MKKRLSVYEMVYKAFCDGISQEEEKVLIF